MEIYTLKIVFPNDENDITWSKTIEVVEDFTMRKLHTYIQKLVEFDDDHLYEFYIGKNPRNKSATASKNKKLNEIYPLTGQKLYYLFDFCDCWIFEIKKLKTNKEEDKKIKYPRLIESTGTNPEQYPEYDE